MVNYQCLIINVKVIFHFTKLDRNLQVKYDKNVIKFLMTRNVFLPILIG